MTRARCTGDSGSSLMLMPVGVLVLLILGAIAADMGHLHSSKRDLIGMANSVANDVATYGLDPDALLRSDGHGYPWSSERADAAAARSIQLHAANDRPGLRLDDSASAATPPLEFDETTRRVRVRLRIDVPYFFAKALPGVDDTVPVTAVGTAVAEGD